jgi:thiol:disulfide interchange protein DsbC
MKSPLLAAALACVSLAALADESDVRKAVEEKMGKVEKIVKAPMPGIWEVTVDGQILYADDKGSHVLFGNLLEVKSGRNLTAERMREIEKALLAGSLDSAIKQVRGSGKNVVMTFEDPNCGYCKRLAKEILALKDVTVYTFLLPVLGDDSFEKSKAIWCAPDKAKAWVDWMTAGKTPPAVPAKCDMAGLNKSTQLGRKLRINGTPAIFFASGERVPGYVPAAEIEKRFAAPGG